MPADGGINASPKGGAVQRPGPHTGNTAARPPRPPCATRILARVDQSPMVKDAGCTSKMRGARGGRQPRARGLGEPLAPAREAASRGSTPRNGRRNEQTARKAAIVAGQGPSTVRPGACRCLPGKCAAAAYLIGGGCSDDDFIDFRAGLMARGCDWYEKARPLPTAWPAIPRSPGGARPLPGRALVLRGGQLCRLPRVRADHRRRRRLPAKGGTSPPLAPERRRAQLIC